MNVKKNNIRIKDIAEEAGVSMGTVDRVIHNRKNVSKSSYEAVKRVLDKYNFKVNRFASALAISKGTTFSALLPMHEKYSYWHSVVEGIKEGVNQFSDYNIDFTLFTYDPFSDASFIYESTKLLSSNPNIILIGPIFNQRIMKEFTDKLDSLKLPYALLDSNFPEFNHKIFYGQDSFSSGAFAAMILSLTINRSKERIAVFKIMGEGRVASRQQMDREVGFRNYLKENCNGVEVVDVNLFAYDTLGISNILKQFFIDNPDINYGLTFNSSIHIIANYIENNRRTEKPMILLGYDAVPKNIECVEKGLVKFLIGQHPFKQGLDCFRSMLNITLLKMNIEREHYMPIDLLTKENIRFYKD